MKLLEICQKTNTLCPEHLRELEIKGITSDSKKVGEGYLFVCLEGTRADGHRFINDALLRGAVAAVIEKEENGYTLLLTEWID